MRRPLASYKCCQCAAEWQQAQARTACAACGSHYVVWTNYPEWAASGPLRPLFSGP